MYLRAITTKIADCFVYCSGKVAAIMAVASGGAVVGMVTISTAAAATTGTAVGTKILNAVQAEQQSVYDNSISAAATTLCNGYMLFSYMRPKLFATGELIGEKVMQCAITAVTTPVQIAAAYLQPTEIHPISEISHSGINQFNAHKL